MPTEKNAAFLPRQEGFKLDRQRVKQFVPAVREHLRSNNLPERAMLLLDNVPSHPNENALKKKKKRWQDFCCISSPKHHVTSAANRSRRIGSIQASLLESFAASSP
jgi:hypothetical protein